RRAVPIDQRQLGLDPSAAGRHLQRQLVAVLARRGHRAPARQRAEVHRRLGGPVRPAERRGRRGLDDPLPRGPYASDVRRVVGGAGEKGGDGALREAVTNLHGGPYRGRTFLVGQRATGEILYGSRLPLLGDRRWRGRGDVARPHLSVVVDAPAAQRAVVVD